VFDIIHDALVRDVGWRAASQDESTTEIRVTTGMREESQDDIISCRMGDEAGVVMGII